MKNLKIISEGKNYSALDIGKLDQLSGYSHRIPRANLEIKGKTFIGEVLKTTGAEISFQVLLPGESMPFIHRHREHEEIYIFIKGEGQFQIDDTLIPVKEGTVIRIAPDGARIWKNNSLIPLVFIVIQVQSGSLKNHFTADGFIVKGETLWDK